MMIYSVSTKYYFGFGVKTSMEIANKLKELPGVTMVEPDSYIDMKNKDYGGEPFVEGKAVPYDRKYHEVWETRQARMEKAAAELEAELATGVHKFEEVKTSWWLMPQIWCKRAYLRWLRYNNKKSQDKKRKTLHSYFSTPSATPKPTPNVVTPTPTSSVFTPTHTPRATPTATSSGAATPTHILQLIFSWKSYNIGLMIVPWSF